MTRSVILRFLVGVSLLTGLVWIGTGAAQEAPTLKEDPAFAFEPSSSRSETSVLDLIAKDVSFFDLRTRPDAVSVRFALTPSDWSLFKGIQPYLALSPSTVRPISESGLGLAAPSREVADQPWKGLGMGAGVEWHLSDRVDLFGQYQFVTLPGASASTGSPIMRRDSDNPGVRAGFSFHF